MSATRTEVVVIGAGIVGVCCATYLLRDGHSVTLLDREAPGEGASKGNAGAMSPGSCTPLAMAGIFHKVPGWLLDADGPLTIRPRYFLRALPWLVRFSLAASPHRVERIADALGALHRPVYGCYEPLLAGAGCANLIVRSGTLVVYRSAAAFSASAREWRMRRERGAEVRDLDTNAIHDLEPDLGPEYTHGVLLPEHGYTTNPHRLVTALAAGFTTQGGRLERAHALGVRRNDDASILTVQCEGREFRAERVVIAAGAWSGALAKSLGVRIPLESQRGYHVTLSDPGIQPRLPVSAAEAKFYATPMEGGLRVAGTVEFAGLEAPPEYRRARLLLAQVRSLFPKVRTEKFTEWMGHRPSLPDSLPVIGSPEGLPGVLLAFGHGHNGMTSAPATGRLIAELVAGRAPFIDPAPYSPARFR